MLRGVVWQSVVEFPLSFSKLHSPTLPGLLDPEDEGNSILRISLNGDTNRQGATSKHPLKTPHLPRVYLLGVKTNRVYSVCETSVLLTKRHGVSPQKT
jgi:hypothetical protein